jgi:branched-chain amino acid transport system substrate-binding protein
LIQQWDADAQKWEAITGFLTAEREVIQPLIVEDSLAYAAENGIEGRCN